MQLDFESVQKQLKDLKAKKDEIIMAYHQIEGAIQVVESLMQKLLTPESEAVKTEQPLES